MRIVQRSACAFYSPFLALPPPKIAGLLPAQAESLHRNTPSPASFIYSEPQLAVLPDSVRPNFDSLTHTLLNATVGLLADDFTEAEFVLASGTFLRQITALYHTSIIGDPKPAIESPFVRARQRLDAKMEELQAQSKARMAETRERVARELVALHAREWQP